MKDLPVDAFRRALDAWRDTVRTGTFWQIDHWGPVAEAGRRLAALAMRDYGDAAKQLQDALAEWRDAIAAAAPERPERAPDKLMLAVLERRTSDLLNASDALAGQDAVTPGINPPANTEADETASDEGPPPPAAGRPTYAMLLKTEEDRVVTLYELARILHRDRKTVRAWLDYPCVRKALPKKAYSVRERSFREGRQIPLHAALKALHKEKQLD